MAKGGILKLLFLQFFVIILILGLTSAAVPVSKVYDIKDHKRGKNKITEVIYRNYKLNDVNLFGSNNDDIILNYEKNDLDYIFFKSNGMNLKVDPVITCSWKPSVNREIKHCESIFEVDGHVDKDLLLANPEIFFNFQRDNAENIKVSYSTEFNEIKEIKSYKEIVREESYIDRYGSNLKVSKILPKISSKAGVVVSKEFKNFKEISSELQIPKKEIEYTSIDVSKTFAIKVEFDMPLRETNKFEFHLEGSGINAEMVQGVSACALLEEDNEVYTLTEDIVTNNSCFQIIGNNITLNCDGYSIDIQSNDSFVTAINIEDSSFATIKNCNISITSVSELFGHGIFMFNTSSSFITENTISLNGEDNSGIFVDIFSSNNEIKENIFLTDNSIFSPGIIVDRWNSNTSVIENIIINSGKNNYGIYMPQEAGSVYIFNNEIKTDGEFAPGIYFEDGALPSIVKENNLITNGTFSIGIYSYLSDGHTIDQNDIFSYGIDGHGILLEESSDVTILENNIISEGLFGSSIVNKGVLVDSRNTIIIGNNLTSMNTDSYGIFIRSSDDIMIINNSINTYGENGYGLLLYQNPKNLSVYNMDIKTYGITADGILLDEDLNNVEVRSSDIKTFGNDSSALYLLSGNLDNLTIIDTSLVSVDEDSPGVFIDEFVNWGVWNLVNTNYEDIRWLNGANGILNRKWDAGVQAEYMDGAPIVNATVSFIDSEGMGLYTEYTNSFGNIRPFPLLSYIQTGPNAIEDKSNYTIEAELPDGYQTLTIPIYHQSIKTYNITAWELVNSPDINEDGVVSYSDLLEILRNWGPCVDCPYDLNGDGIVSQIDLDILLNSWS